jgi:hypothetical protein
MNDSSENMLQQDKAQIIKELKVTHNTFKLLGNKRDDLLNIPDKQLMYLLSILRYESNIVAPNLDKYEWYDFINFLNRHFITPFMYKFLNKMPVESRPPPEIFEKIKTVYLKGVSRSVKIERLLNTILDTANKNNIQILVLKGQAVARTIYAYPALRHSTDIDLLVSPDDVLRLRVILENMGYACFEKRFEHYQAGYCEEVYYPNIENNFKISVEVHWKLYPFYQLNRFIDVKSLFRRAIKVESNGISFETLDYIDSLIFAAAHMIYDHNGDIRLNWIIDISLLGKKLSKPDDWLELQRRSASQGSILAVENALLMAQLWTDFQIPDEFKDLTKWPAPSKQEVKNFSKAIRHNTLDLIWLIYPKDASLSEKFHVIYRLAFPDYSSMSDTNNIPILWHKIQSYFKRWWRLTKDLFK